MLLETAIYALREKKDLGTIISATALKELTPLLACANRAMEKMSAEFSENNLPLSTFRIKSPESTFFKLLARKKSSINVLTDILAATIYTDTIEQCYDTLHDFAIRYSIYGRKVDTLNRIDDKKYHSLHFLIVTQDAPIQIRIKPKQWQYEDTLHHGIYKKRVIKKLQDGMRLDPKKILVLEKVYRDIEDLWIDGAKKINNTDISLIQALNIYSDKIRNYKQVTCNYFSKRSNHIIEEIDKIRNQATFYHTIEEQVKEQQPKEQALQHNQV